MGGDKSTDVWNDTAAMSFTRNETVHEDLNSFHEVFKSLLFNANKLKYVFMDEKVLLNYISFEETVYLTYE